MKTATATLLLVALLSPLPLFGRQETPAPSLSTLYGLLVTKNGHLIAEGCFNEGSVDQLSARQSVTKSYTSARVGVAPVGKFIASLPAG